MKSAKQINVLLNCN